MKCQGLTKVCFRGVGPVCFILFAYFIAVHAVGLPVKIRIILFALGYKNSLPAIYFSPILLQHEKEEGGEVCNM